MVNISNKGHWQCHSTTIKLNNCFSISLPLKFNTIYILLQKYCRAETLVKLLHYIRLYKHCMTIRSNNTIICWCRKIVRCFLKTPEEFNCSIWGTQIRICFFILPSMFKLPNSTIFRSKRQLKTIQCYGENSRLSNNNLLLAKVLRWLQ